jgi:pyrimidine operon attenuation protein/uracil phosphoribosyltransferase
MHTHYDGDDVARVIAALADKLANTFSPDEPLGVIGIRTRGEVLAERLARALRDRDFARIERGTLDITLYRDDLSEIGPKPLVRPTAVPFALDGLPVLLVDDVLFTGRSIRAALSALSDFGRPAVIRLVVLADRGGRELPIQADFVGLMLKDVPRDYRVNVRLKEVDQVDEITVEPKP